MFLILSHAVHVTTIFNPTFVWLPSAKTISLILWVDNCLIVKDVKELPQHRTKHLQIGHWRGAIQDKKPFLIKRKNFSWFQEMLYGHQLMLMIGPAKFLTIMRYREELLAAAEMMIAYRAGKLYATTSNITCAEHIQERNMKGVHHVLIWMGKVMGWMHCMGKACLFDWKEDWNDVSWNRIK